LVLAIEEDWEVAETIPGKGHGGHFVSQVIDFIENEVSKSVEPRFPQQRFLYLRLEPQGQGTLRPMLWLRTGAFRFARC
jgi:hypothetical protein